MSFFISNSLKNQITESMLDEMENDIKSENINFPISIACGQMHFEIATYKNDIGQIDLHMERDVYNNFINTSKNTPCTIKIFSNPIFRFNFNDMHILSYKAITNDLIEISISIERVECTHDKSKQ